MAGLTKEQKAERALQAKAIELSGLKAEEFALLSTDEQAAYTGKAQEAIHESAAKPDPEVDVDNSHLIAVTKGGETIHVHPTCLAAHRAIGWKEA